MTHDDALRVGGRGARNTIAHAVWSREEGYMVLMRALDENATRVLGEGTGWMKVLDGSTRWVYWVRVLDG